jgi:hypothetical protein
VRDRSGETGKTPHTPYGKNDAYTVCDPIEKFSLPSKYWLSNLIDSAKTCQRNNKKDNAFQAGTTGNT